MYIIYISTMWQNDSYWSVIWLSLNTNTLKELYLESTVTEHSYDTQKYHCGQYSSGYDNSSSCHPTSSPSNSDTGTGSDIINKRCQLQQHIWLSIKSRKGQHHSKHRCNVLEYIFSVRTLIEQTQKVIL